MPRGLGRLGRRGLLVQLASVVPRATGETLDRWGPQGRRDRGGGQDREVTWVLLGLLAGWVSKGRWDRREWDLQVHLALLARWGLRVTQDQWVSWALADHAAVWDCQATKAREAIPAEACLAKLGRQGRRAPKAWWVCLVCQEEGTLGSAAHGAPLDCLEKRACLVCLVCVDTWVLLASLEDVGSEAGPAAQEGPATMAPWATWDQLASLACQV